MFKTHSLKKLTPSLQLQVFQLQVMTTCCHVVTWELQVTSHKWRELYSAKQSENKVQTKSFGGN